MSAGASNAATALDRRFLLDFPYEAARQLESMSADEAADVLAAHPSHVVTRVWQVVSADVADEILERLPQALTLHVLAEAEPVVAVDVLSRRAEADRNALLAGLEPQVAAELRELLRYPEDSAGRLMDPDVSPLNSGLTVGQALARLRRIKRKGLRQMFVTDDTGRLVGRVEIQDLATTPDEAPVGGLLKPLVAVCHALDPREDVVEILDRQPITELPVVNVGGRFIGVIRHATLMSTLEEETSIDIQTMVGASRDERALSSPLFAVRKRLPWLQINLLTAFLAASVVGLFEGTIAKFTALAVTMRGLVLREITLRHWRHVVFKEAGVGLANGLAVAATTAIGVYFWSGSAGLVAVICAAMVIAMVIAGIAGALVPIALSRFGLDPAQSSSIVLTTVTDVAGFFSFLGIASLLAAHL